MRFTKKILTIATCAVMAASSMVGLIANASFSSTALTDCGTIDSLGLSFRQMASIDITDGIITGTSNAYEKDGKSFPLYSVYSYITIYTESDAFVNGMGCPYYGGSKATVSVSAEAQSGKQYYCIGSTTVDSDNDGSITNNTAIKVKTGTIS